MKKSLSKKEKKQFEKKVQLITEIDEQKVKDKTPNEIEKLKELSIKSKTTSKLQELLKNAQLLFDILNENEFYLPGISKKWIIFSLEYLISPYDLIPDTIPVIGYIDDALVISWVMYLINDDILRFHAFKKAKEAQNKKNLLINLSEGTNNKEIIIVSGILSKPQDPSYTARWLKNLNKIYPDSSISIFNWNIITCRELNKVIRNLNHRLALKILYDTKKFTTDWNDAKQHSTFYAKALVNNIKDLQSKTSNRKDIIIICHSLGARLVSFALDEFEKDIVDEIFILAGATIEKSKLVNNIHKVKSLTNLYSTKDFVLKFIFENFENTEKPIGISPVYEGQIPNLYNINCSKEIKKHSDYKDKLADLFKKFNLK